MTPHNAVPSLMRFHHRRRASGGRIRLAAPLLFMIFRNRLARVLREVPVLIMHSPELRLTHLSEVLGAARIALERAEVRRSIPRTSVQRADSKDVEDLSRAQHLTCIWNMLMAPVPCAEIPMRSRANSREFAVIEWPWEGQVEGPAVYDIDIDKFEFQCHLDTNDTPCMAPGASGRACCGGSGGSQTSMGSAMYRQKRTHACRLQLIMS